MNHPRIAVVGIACRYPDADSPDQLWQNVLAGRRAFRRLPDERMRLADYHSPDPKAPDRFYSPKAAVIEGFTFDRVKHRVPGSTYRSTDMTHWLALDTADRALEDAGFGGGSGLPRTTTGVVIGNTLGGEFSRANLMRLRWPYVRRCVGAALRERGWDGNLIASFLAELEERYKSPFPSVGEDTLAGGLANTIAGRICNHYDVNGGGFTVDGACSSSLLSVSVACDALAGGRLDVAIAGGVDLSIDPFEVIGFAKTGALATGEMRVYDRNSNGFWPGEGCGMLVLMRDTDALAQKRFRYATIAGWGSSSDGKGGITRPEVRGHRLALERAYARAGFGIDSVSYLEGHGTGTAVGDATELRAFSEARRAADPAAPPVAISTVKGNLGHTKSAAGAAGLIKAILAVRHQVIPPATSHVQPHPELTGERPAIRVPATAEPWPPHAPIRAGVSSMGFGGINAHVVVEHADGLRKAKLGTVTRRLERSRQDCELLLLDADSATTLRERAGRLAGFSARLSFAELSDLAATLRNELSGGPLRAAIVADSPEQTVERFRRLLTLLESGRSAVIDDDAGVFIGDATSPPRTAFLFPGQGAGRRGNDGALRRRFASVDELYRANQPPTADDPVATAVAQPRIVTSCVAGLRVLDTLGIEAVGAVGHSLGELTALHWAGAMDEGALLDIAAVRGRIMAEASDGNGAMASIAAAPEPVAALLASEPVVIAGYNSPTQSVVSGPAHAVQRVCERAALQGHSATRIAVSHAFHSQAVAPAATAFGTHLAEVAFTPLRRRMVSTVTGEPLAPDTDIRRLLVRQVVNPVRFSEAVAGLAPDVDLFLEVGPGRVLRGLVGEIAPTVPVLSLETDSPSLSGLLHAIGAAYVLGAPVRYDALFGDRFTRPLSLDKEFAFFTSPCESAPDGVFDTEETDAEPASTAGSAASPADDGEGGGETTGSNGSAAGSLEVLMQLAADRAELPLAAVTPDSNLLDELHLSSITVGQIVNQASQQLGLPAPVATSAFATSTVAELAAMLDELGGTSREDEPGQRVAQGVGPWVRAFSVDFVPAEAGQAAAPVGSGAWRLFAPDGHPVARELHEALNRAGCGGGVALCLPQDCDEGHVAVMLAAARAALAADRPTRFVTVGDRRGAAGLAKTLHLEAPDIVTTVITLPLPQDMPAERVRQVVPMLVGDVAATVGFSEVRYDEAGLRTVPVLRPWALAADRAAAEPLVPGDVLLVTGGGKGITAECALALARDTGASVGLLGRSVPETDPELAGNLARMAAAGVTFRYVQADVTSADEVKEAVNEIQLVLGPVTAVLHGAGRNAPNSLAHLDESAFRRTLAPKTAGLESVLAATDPGALRLLITFGSIIGRAGLRGQADYATANDWLTDLTRRIQDSQPDCRCIALEWSVWSGTGMGARLGVLESLMREGIEPIPIDEGIAVLKQAIADPHAPTALVVMGRAGALPTLTVEHRDLPLLRFVDRVQVHYPGIELVADAELSAGGDLYLADHLLDGDLLFPAVFGLEAMTQVVSALTGRPEAPVLEDVEFPRPIVVPVDGTTTIRIAALAKDDTVVQAVVRSSETGFQADHFRATLRYPGAAPAEDRRGPDTGPALRLPLDPERELYGPVLFQGPRFQRLLGYRRLTAQHCTAEISNVPVADWFAGFLPRDLILGDPGTRDALIHAGQCCVPEATLLPVAVERLRLADPNTVRDADTVTLHAEERRRDGDTHVFDLDVRDPAGRLVERWEGLRLQAVRKRDGTGPWEPTLLGPYLERHVETVLDRVPRCVVWPDGDEPADGLSARRRQTARAVSCALGRETIVRYRPDGRPEIDGELAVSSSHGAGTTFAVVGTAPVGCDVETAVARPAEEWSRLIGAAGLTLARLLAGERGEALSLAATRVWGAMECLRKAGHARPQLTAATRGSKDRWVELHAGKARIASFPATLRGRAEPVVFTILTEGDD